MSIFGSDDTEGKSCSSKYLTLKTLRNISAYSLSVWGIMCITSPNNGSPLAQPEEFEKSVFT